MRPEGPDPLSTQWELLNRYPHVQWRVDNLNEIERFLQDFQARCRVDTGDRLLLQTWGGLDTYLNPGDTLLLDDKRLGIVRGQIDDSAVSDTAH